jgi:SAM-dependent methyltransferase
MGGRDHWEGVYSSKSTASVSWFQEHAEVSLRLIRATGVPRTASIIDVGGGASTLVDDLLSQGYTELTVVDLAAAALSAAKARLGELAGRVHWMEADITSVQLPPHGFDVWHDRAVFHFLNTGAERESYLEALRRAVKPGGHVVIATFAEDGPARCSGLPVSRYRADQLQALFGSGFSLLHQEREEHRTPAGAVQKFLYCGFRKTPG